MVNKKKNHRSIRKKGSREGGTGKRDREDFHTSAVCYVPKHVHTRSGRDNLASCKRKTVNIGDVPGMFTAAQSCSHPGSGGAHTAPPARWGAHPAGHRGRVGSPPPGCSRGERVGGPTGGPPRSGWAERRSTPEDTQARPGTPRHIAKGSAWFPPFRLRPAGTMFRLSWKGVQREPNGSLS